MKSIEQEDREIDFKNKLSQLMGEFNAELWGVNNSLIYIYFGENKKEELPFEYTLLAGVSCGFGYYHEIIKSEIFKMAEIEYPYVEV